MDQVVQKWGGLKPPLSPPPPPSPYPYAVPVKRERVSNDMFLIPHVLG